MYKKYLYLTIFLSVSLNCLALCNADSDSKAANFSSLLIPAFIAALGYLGKNIYESYIKRNKRKRKELEEKLKNFYWPILTRLEFLEDTWQLILDKHNKDQTKKTIADFAEKEIVMGCHTKIMKTILKYRYLAQFNIQLSQYLSAYFKHVATYEGIMKSGANIFPTQLGAPYPKELYTFIKEKTEQLQKELDKM